jgi:hypothetical protein
MRRSARERLQNMVRDFFGTFGAAGCALVPFRSLNGGGHAAGALRKVPGIKGFLDPFAASRKMGDQPGKLVFLDGPEGVTVELSQWH